MEPDEDELISASLDDLRFRDEEGERSCGFPRSGFVTALLRARPRDLTGVAVPLRPLLPPLGAFGRLEFLGLITTVRAGASSPRFTTQL